MSYVKLPKVVTDSPLGFQTVNQFADNCAEMRTQMFVEHGNREFLLQPPGIPGIGGGALQGYDFHKLGHHDLAEIPRTVSKTFLFTPTAGVTSVGMDWTGPAVTGVLRWSTGVYLFAVKGLAHFWATAAVLGTSSDTYLQPQVRAYFGSQTVGFSNSLWISVYKLSGGAFVAADAAITFCVYGEVL